MGDVAARVPASTLERRYITWRAGRAGSQGAIDRVDRRQVGEFRRDLDQRLVDQHRHWVEVGGVRLQAEALGFQWDRATTRERVINRGWVATSGAHDLGAGRVQHPLVVRVLPLNQLLD